jgi:uncharacterized membrane protein
VPGIASPLLTVYPTIPWLAPTLLGLVFGRAVHADRQAAFRRIAVAGAVCLVLFVALRATGDVGSFQVVEPGWIGFLNVTKYPPSLTFLLLTLGANFLVIGGLELSGAGASRALAPLRVFGAVPLFFFVTHLWVYGAIGKFFPGGMTIAQMFPWWLIGLALLYLPCRWYGTFKGRRPPNSPFRLL